MAASMESSGQTRAATLMNAARRSHFVSRIEKYEAKVRQAKALVKERDALAMVEQKQSVSNIEGPLVVLPQEQKEANMNQRRPTFNPEEQQCYISERKILIPVERAHMHFPVHPGAEQKSYSHHDPPYKQPHNNVFKDSHQNDYSLDQELHEKEYLSQEESLYQHPRGNSPDLKTHTEQKEIISGVLQRSTSSSMPSIVRGIDGLDMNFSSAAASEKDYPVGFEPSETHANMFFDFKPPRTLEINIATIAGALKIRIKAADMSAPMQEHAFRRARDCLDVVGKLQSKRIAYTLKKDFDKVYGPAWHCIVGTSFGSYVTHSLGGFVYFSLDKVSVLLFKTTVEPIENP